MALTLSGAITQIQTIISGITGINGAPSDEVDQTDIFPFVVTFPDSGDLAGVAYGERIYFHTIIAEVHTARNDVHKTIANLVSDISNSITLGELVADTLLSPTNLTLSGEVSHINEIRYTFGPLGFAGVDTLGWSFEIDVKITGDTQ